MSHTTDEEHDTLMELAETLQFVEPDEKNVREMSATNDEEHDTLMELAETLQFVEPDDNTRELDFFSLDDLLDHFEEGETAAAVVSATYLDAKQNPSESGFLANETLKPNEFDPTTNASTRAVDSAADVQKGLELDYFVGSAEDRIDHQRDLNYSSPIHKLDDNDVDKCGPLFLFKYFICGV